MRYTVDDVGVLVQELAQQSHRHLVAEERLDDLVLVQLVLKHSDRLIDLYIVLEQSSIIIDDCKKNIYIYMFFECITGNLAYDTL